MINHYIKRFSLLIGIFASMSLAEAKYVDVTRPDIKDPSFVPEWQSSIGKVAEDQSEVPRTPIKIDWNEEDQFFLFADDFYCEGGVVYDQDEAAFIFDGETEGRIYLDLTGKILDMSEVAKIEVKGAYWKPEKDTFNLLEPEAWKTDDPIGSLFIGASVDSEVWPINECFGNRYSNDFNNSSPLASKVTDFYFKGRPIIEEVGGVKKIIGYEPGNVYLDEVALTKKIPESNTHAISGDYHVSRALLYYLSDEFKFANGEVWLVESGEDDYAWDCEIGSNSEGNLSFFNLLGSVERIRGTYNEACDTLIIPAQKFDAEYGGELYEMGICGGLKGHNDPQDLMNYIDNYGSWVPANLIDAKLSYDKSTNTISLDSPLLIYFSTDVFGGYVGYASFLISELILDGEKKVEQKPLEGSIVLLEDKFVYDGVPKEPLWQFTSDSNKDLKELYDYEVSYRNNIYPGEGYVEVTGVHEYTGTLTASFFIEKGSIESLENIITLPEENILYDGQSHGAVVSSVAGIGEVKITYVNEESNTISEEAPVNAGSYDVFVEIAEGKYYYGKENHKVGSFTIYDFDENEWQALNLLNTQLLSGGWNTGWDIPSGVVAVGKFEGLNIKKGHLVGIDFSDKGLTEMPSGLVAFSQLESLNLSHNQLEGNAALIPSQLPNLKELDLSYNCFADLFPMISPNVTSLDLSHQSIDRTIELNLSTAKLSQLATLVPSIIMYDHENQTFDPNIQVLCTTGETSNVTSEDWAMQIAVQNRKIVIPYVSENNDYHGQSGDILNVFDVKSGSSFKLKLNFDPGDANFLDGVDAADLQATILFAFGLYKNYPFNFTAADTHSDGSIDILDVICTVNLLLSQSVKEVPSTMRVPEFGVYDSFDSEELMEIAQYEASIYFEDGNIILDSEKPVAAISIKASGNVAWCLDRYGLTQSLQVANAVGYSLSGATIAAGRSVIGSYDGEVTIGQISIADIEAQSISIAMEQNHTSGIENNLNDLIDADAQIYDILGRKVNYMGTGVNIIRKGNKTIKVIGGANK